MLYQEVLSSLVFLWDAELWFSAEMEAMTLGLTNMNASSATTKPTKAAGTDEAEFHVGRGERTTAQSTGLYCSTSTPVRSARRFATSGIQGENALTERGSCI